jgi:hypothetical protein
LLQAQVEDDPMTVTDVDHYRTNAISNVAACRTTYFACIMNRASTATTMTIAMATGFIV